MPAQCLCELPVNSLGWMSRVASGATSPRTTRTQTVAPARTKPFAACAASVPLREQPAPDRQRRHLRLVRRAVPPQIDLPVVARDLLLLQERILLLRLHVIRVIATRDVRLVRRAPEVPAVAAFDLLLHHRAARALPTMR